MNRRAETLSRDAQGICNDRTATSLAAASVIDDR